MSTILARLTRRPSLDRRQVVRLAGVALLVFLPWILLGWNKYQELYNLNSAGFYILVILSLVLLTGWVGQISLAHAALVGVGTYTAANVSRSWGFNFPLQLVCAGIAGGLFAVLVGLPSLRLRGLYLAVATLAFQWMTEASVFQWASFTGGYEGRGSKPLSLPGLGLQSGTDRVSFRDHQEWLYYVVLGLIIVTMIGLANLRDTKTGRAFFAIRDSEMAARSLGIDIIRYKLIAFVTSGVLAGMAGAVLANQIERVSTATFAFTRSIAFVVFAIIGGIGGLPGAVLAGVAFMVGEVVQANVTALRGYLDVFAGTLVIITLLQNPDGLAGIPAKLRHERDERRLKRELRRAEEAERGAPVVIDLAEAGVVSEPAAATDALGAAEANVEVADAVERSAFDIFRQAGRSVDHHPMTGGARRDTEPLLVAQEVTVRFGGVVANDSVTMEVRRGEIVGLIGPNGAGKTTFFNAVSGFVVPNQGRVFALGREVTNTSVHARAALGIGRTFQSMRLLPKLTVYENLLVATHMANRSGFWNDLVVSRVARDAEAHARATVDDMIGALGIESVQGHRVADLPFGVLRMVELARALVTKPQLLLLDEPASGLESEETELFGQILLDVRDRFDVTMLLIEHDMSLVMAVSDYVYVLEFGQMLASGTCDQVQTDDAVIAAYLGQPAGAAAAASGQEEPVAIG